MAAGAANGSFAAADLGLEQSVANPGNVLHGDDVNPIKEQGVFKDLYDLRDALQANDSVGISRAGAALQAEISRVAGVRGTVGVRLQTFTQTKTRVQDELVQAKTLLSNVRDLDYAGAVTQFQSLQAMYQASLQSAATILPLSLMDFLKL